MDKKHQSASPAETTHQHQEQHQETAAPAPEVAKSADGEKSSEHDAVSPGGVCSKCGWTWGDPVKGLEPHIVYFGAARQEPAGPPPPPPARAAKESDPRACPAVVLDGMCPKCGWSREKSPEAPHPILL